MEVPFVDLKAQYKSLKKELDKSLLDVARSGMFILGKQVSDFEQEASKYLGVSALGCASGSDALLLALMASRVGFKDEVITTPFTFFATAGAVSRLGARPIFVDIDEKTYNIDPSKIERAVTKRTRAVIPVHIFGQPVDMAKTETLAKKYRLKVIEDACQAIGAEYKGKKAGSIGDFGCFSFFPTKNIACFGDGGLITCKSKRDYNLVRALRVHGSKVKYFHDFVGINSRLDAIQAAILNVKIGYIDEWARRRINVAKVYTKGLENLVEVPFVLKGVKHVFHQYVILTDRRGDLKDFLKKRGIETGIYYPLPLHLQKCFKDLGYKKGDFPISERVCKQVLSLPIFPEITNKQVEYVIRGVRAFFRG